ncbi:MAG: hypothetical protein IPK71_28020 [Myxococcales bacterium]|nr:hypothetical protein [Myxococcales bacterium]
MGFRTILSAGSRADRTKPELVGVLKPAVVGPPIGVSKRDWGTCHGSEDVTSARRRAS